MRSRYNLPPQQVKYCFYRYRFLLKEVKAHFYSWPNLPAVLYHPGNGAEVMLFQVYNVLFTPPQPLLPSHLGAYTCRWRCQLPSAIAHPWSWHMTRHTSLLWSLWSRRTAPKSKVMLCSIHLDYPVMCFFSPLCKPLSKQLT